MTREEYIRAVLEGNFTGFKNDIIDNAVENICKFKQKSCEDCVSREAVLDIDFDSIYLTYVRPSAAIRNEIRNLPSVQPKAEQEQIGCWERITDKTGHLVWECSNCGWQQRFFTKYCPDCGTKMKKYKF